MLLANHFAMKITYELERDEVVVFSDDVVQSLKQYNWKGNVRELKNVVERAVYRSDNGAIDEIIFDPFVSPFGAMPEPKIEKHYINESEVPEPVFVPLVLKDAVAALEVKLLRQAMDAGGRNGRKAAKLLGMTYYQFRGKIKKYGRGIFA
jgi:psp operon transcriptional activator